MAHERFPKREACHLGVWLVVKQSVERVLERFLFPAAVVVLVDVQRQPRNGFGQDPHAGIHRRHLHGGRFVHWLSARCSSEEETVPAAVKRVLRLVAGMNNSLEWVRLQHLQRMKKSIV